MGVCRWCNGTGREVVEQGSSLAYRCPDCNGTGHIPECDICGQELTGEYCRDCYAECKECGAVCRIDDMEDCLCEDCAEVVSE